MENLNVPVDWSSLGDLVKCLVLVAIVLSPALIFRNPNRVNKAPGAMFAIAGFLVAAFGGYLSYILVVEGQAPIVPGAICLAGLVMLGSGLDLFTLERDLHGKNKPQDPRKMFDNDQFGGRLAARSRAVNHLLSEQGLGPKDFEGSRRAGGMGPRYDASTASLLKARGSSAWVCRHCFTVMAAEVENCHRCGKPKPKIQEVE